MTAKKPAAKKAPVEVKDPVKKDAAPPTVKCINCEVYLPVGTKTCSNCFYDQP